MQEEAGEVFRVQGEGENILCQTPDDTSTGLLHSYQLSQGQGQECQEERTNLSAKLNRSLEAGGGNGQSRAEVALGETLQRHLKSLDSF